MKAKQLYLKPEFWAAILVAVFGAFQTLQKLNIDIQSLISDFWPTVFILLAFLQLCSRRYRDVTSIILLLGIGIVLLQAKLHFIPTENIQRVWADTLLILFNTTDFANYLFSIIT